MPQAIIDSVCSRDKGVCCITGRSDLPIDIIWIFLPLSPTRKPEGFLPRMPSSVLPNPPLRGGERVLQNGRHAITVCTGLIGPLAENVLSTDIAACNTRCSSPSQPKRSVRTRTASSHSRPSPMWPFCFDFYTKSQAHEREIIIKFNNQTRGSCTGSQTYSPTNRRSICRSGVNYGATQWKEETGGNAAAYNGVCRDARATLDRPADTLDSAVRKTCRQTTAER